MIDLKKTSLGIEFGSTRIKAVLIDENHLPVASGSFEWENRLIDGIWTYTMDDIHGGLQACFADLKKNVKEELGVTLTTVGAIGVSAMMHGYLVFDKDDNLLTGFRTWRNTMTGEAAEKLTKLFDFNIPQRWSIAHLYQAILNKEDHVERIAFITSLAGYIHYVLTGEKILGVGDASGISPLDSETLDYNEEYLAKFDAISGMPWKCRDIFPKSIMAGDPSGKLTPEGARILDPEGDLEPGIPFAPCEGDAGTGMVATNSVRVGTGNVSAGTSDFAMLVIDKKLNVHREIDMVTTPAGKPVAMVHCNNCTSDINAWVELFSEFADMVGASVSKGDLFTMLFKKALEGDLNGGGLMNYNYFSGEGVMDIDDGRPFFTRTPDCKFNMANFMRTQLLSTLATLKIGLDILTIGEKVTVDKIYGHGGFFKTPEVGQRLLSAAIGGPVAVMKTAGEGGPYGMALLCAYLLEKEDGESLEDFLDNKVFAEAETVSLMAGQDEIDGFNDFLDRYKKAFVMELDAIKVI